MIERLKIIENRYLELNKLLSDQEIVSDFQQVKKINKERSALEETVEKYIEYKKNQQDLESLNEMLTNPDFEDEAKNEIGKLNQKNETLVAQLEKLLIPKDENDNKDVIVEIRGAAGGDEANIFAGDLFRMYAKYAEKNNWELDVTNEINGSSGGYSQVEFIIRGENVYSKLKYESGSHRVQRVPETETQGRIHTSTATVLVIYEIDDVEIDIKEGELQIDVYHSGGAGGQSVNTTNSAVRITHLPSGIVVTCQNERSQMKNKDKALSILKTRLYDSQVRKLELETGADRRSKIGTGDRSEKIRTYNYPQNRVTDHRINFSVMNLDRVMEGYLDEIIEQLITEDQRLKLESK